MHKFKICDLIIEIDAPAMVLHENLMQFCFDTVGRDIYCRVIFEKRSSAQIHGVKPMVKTAGMSIYELNGFIHIWSGVDTDIPSYIIVSSDWSVCTMYIDPEYSDLKGQAGDSVRDGILAALRNIMLAMLARKQGLIIHSCSIIWNQKGILFSAPSGTGKSTHANLWRRLYGTPVLDGDATACRMIDGKPVAYGLPWCGTSGEFINRSVPLCAIVFLQQAKENSIQKIEFQEAFLRLTARSFLLPWNDAMTNRFLDAAQNMAQNADCYVLNCRPDAAAVEVVKKCLERT